MVREGILSRVLKHRCVRTCAFAFAFAYWREVIASAEVLKQTKSHVWQFDEGLNFAPASTGGKEVGSFNPTPATHYQTRAHPSFSSVLWYLLSSKDVSSKGTSSLYIHWSQELVLFC